MEMKYTLLPFAVEPKRAHADDAGLDLFTPVPVYIPPHQRVIIDTGVAVELPVIDGYKTVGYIKSKSGLMIYNGILTDGTIDIGYTGSIKVCLFNTSDEAFITPEGSKIAQLVVNLIVTPELVKVDKLDESERGANGFGSTGK